MRRVGRAIAFCLTLFSGAAMAETTYTLLNFSDLNGWAEDDHSAAFTAFKETCDLMSDPEWTTLCNLSNDVSDARGFFELFFKPVMVTDGEPSERRPFVTRFTAYPAPCPQLVRG